MTLDRRQFLTAVGSGVLGLHLLEASSTQAPAVELAAPSGWSPGVEQHLTSTCLICPSRCGIRGRIVDGRLVRIDGNPLHPFSRGGLCPRGAAGVQTLYHPDRLRSPRVRIGPRGEGNWRDISWDTALGVLAERLGQLRAVGHPERLAVLAGDCSGSMDDLWRQFLRAYGSPNYVTNAYADGTDAVMAAMHGIPRRPAYDFERAGLVLSFGAPLFEAWWSPIQAQVAFGRSGEGRARRPRFVQVDTRFSRTAARAHEWVGVRPRTYALLALGLAYVLIKEERVDAAFLRDHVAGFEDWTDGTGTTHEGYRSIVLRHYRTEEVSVATGVPVERIVGLAKAYAEGAPALAVCGQDVTLAPDGLLAGLAVHSLNLLVGSVNRPGGVLVGDDPPLTALPHVTPDEVARRALARGGIAIPAPFHGPTALGFAQAIGAAEPGSVEVLLLYSADPLASTSRPEIWAAALERVPLVVSFSPFPDETARQADMVLPDLLPYERWQDGVAPASYPYSTWGLVRPLVEPPAGAPSAGDLLLALAKRLGGPTSASLPYGDFATLLKARARGLFEVRRGMPFGDDFETAHQRQMEERGWWLGAESDFEAFWNALVERGGWTDPFYDDTDPARLRRTRSGKIELLPAPVLRQLELTGSRSGPYRFTAPDEEERHASEYPLRLNPYRLSTLSSGTLGLAAWMAERPTVFPDVHWTPWVEVSPATARALGLADGVMAWVISSRGRYRARVKHAPGAARDVVNSPYGLNHPDGEPANPLQILDGSSDPLTGLASWCTTFVRLERA